MADHSQKWHAGSSSRNVDSSSNFEGITAIVSKLDNLGRDMKKLKENVHAIHVGCQTCRGPYLDKECPLNEEVTSIEEVIYREFGRPFPNNNRNDGRFSRGVSRYGSHDQPSSGERKPSLTEIINKYMEEAAKRHAEHDEWGKFEECKEIFTKDGSPLYTPFFYSPKEIEYFFANSGFSNDEKQETKKSGDNEAVATIDITPNIKQITQCTPKGIVKNLLVNIEKFTFPIHFVILDMIEDFKMPIILGRPLLATAHAKVDIFIKSISLGVANEKVIFKMRHSFPYTPVESVHAIRSEVRSENDELINIDYDLFLYESESYKEKHYWESTNGNERLDLAWEELNFNDWRFSDDQDNMDPPVETDKSKECEDPKECGEYKANALLGAVLDKLNSDWFNGTSKDKDDLEWIIDFLEPTSYDVFIDLDDEAYKERKSNMAYKKPPPILIEKVEVTSKEMEFEVTSTRDYVVELLLSAAVTTWQKKMYFLLSSMSVVYVLTTPIPEDGLILNGVADSLFDIYHNVESSKELWDSLEAKYMAEDASSKKFLVSNFTNYKMTDSRPVLEQYNELLGILRRFTQHKMNMDESIQVSCIIDKLPPSWKDFKHTLKHLKEELTLAELGSHLRIEESLGMHDSDKPKGNNVAGPSVVNMVEHNNSSRYNDNKGKHKHHDNTKADPNKKSKVTCWKCGKPGHLKKDCKGGKVGNKANGSGINDSVDSSTNSLKGQNMFNKYFQVYYVTYVSKAYYVQDDDVAWLNIVNDNISLAFMSTSKLNGSILWHARLGHVHFKRMQDMSKDGLIPAFNMDTENDLCDLHATPSLGNKFFITVVRLPDPKLKTLGEIGIKCIFVGYAKHSKAFRFYVIEPNDSVSINSIIESRDAIFDEKMRIDSHQSLDQVLGFLMELKTLMVQWSLKRS
ncbi:zinc finger, CCHC-type containing protein [Tanacetum coccineum]